MIKKLRNRFLLITMSLISLVLLVTFSALIISSANKMKADSFRSLEENHMRLEGDVRPAPIVKDEPSFPILKNEKPFDGYSPFSAFFVTVDSEGVVRGVDDFSRELTEETFNKAAGEAIKQGKDEGVISTLSLRYRVFSGDDGQAVIGFIDISFERSFIRQQILNYCFIGIGSLLAFFAISLVLSKMAIKPVKSAWEKQQRFVADASHELKTPITVILANTSILLSGGVKEESERKKWISYIELEARRMKKLVEDMLFLARVDSKESEEAHARMCLSDVVIKSALPFEAVMYEYGKTLEPEIDENIWIMGSEGRIKQLVYILLDNANKYAEDNSKIKIFLKKEGSKAHLSVNNFGEPIDEKDILYIFDRFIRADKARTGGKNSYGLGLAIAKEIVAAHDGKINVTSSREEGTTFTVSLPAV